VLALLVYFYAQRQQWPLAHQAIEGMRARRIAVEPFVDAPLVVAVYQNVGLDAYAAGALGGAAADGGGGGAGAAGHGGAGGDGGVDEEIEDADGKR